MSQPFQPQAYLIDINLDKVALCNQGANSGANILLTKRKESTNMPKTLKEIMDALDTDAAAVIEKAKTDAIALAVTDAVAKAVKEKDVEITTLTETVAKATTVVTPAATPEGDNLATLLKSVDPKLASMVTDLQKSVEQLQNEQLEGIATSRYNAVKAIPGVDEKDLKAVLKSISPAGYAILKAAADAVSKTVLKDGAGSEGEGNAFANVSDAAYDTLEKSAKELMTVEKCTYEAAFTKACTQNPTLYKQYAKGVK